MSPRPLRLRRVLFVLLALVLLQAQLLGDRHRVLHSPLAAAGVTAQPGGGDAVFGHAGSESAECRLFDQLGGAGGLLFAPPQGLSFAAAAHAVVAVALVARSAAPRGLAQARAPPQA